jgi:hypothetical protein
VTAANLEDTVVGTNAELIDDRPESLTHSPMMPGAFGAWHAFAALTACGSRTRLSCRGHRQGAAFARQEPCGAARSLVRQQTSWLRDGRECGETLVEQLRESREGLVDVERKSEALAGLE